MMLLHYQPDQVRLVGAVRHPKVANRNGKYRNSLESSATKENRKVMRSGGQYQ
jgi:hypothetical protein